jgi:ADP-heptose:LPS heptosyltransferase
VLTLLDADLDIRPRLYPDEAARFAAARLIEGAGTPSVGLFVDAAVELKRWPVERSLELAAKLEHAGLSPVVLAGPESGALLQPFRARGLRAHTMPHPLVFAECIRRLATIVTNDTVTAHLADAVGVAAVVIYGPTPPRRFAPYGGGHRLLHGGFRCDVYLRRCDAQQDGRACDRRCLNAITVDQAFEATLALVPRSRRGSDGSDPRCTW